MFSKIFCCTLMVGRQKFFQYIGTYVMTRKVYKDVVLTFIRQRNASWRRWCNLNLFGEFLMLKSGICQDYRWRFCNNISVRNPDFIASEPGRSYRYKATFSCCWRDWFTQDGISERSYKKEALLRIIWLLNLRKILPERERKKE